MSVDCFIDTNVFVYAVGGRGPDDWKRERAFEILAPAGFGTSAQVLQDFFVNVTRKIKVPLTAREAIEWIERRSLRPVVAIDAALVAIAAHTAARYQLSYWDGAIIAAAQSIGAPILYSEDLNDGQVYSGVKVINPFRVK